MSAYLPRRRRGFSLLEVMVALAILVVTVAVLVETQGSAAKITRDAERVITATDLANAKMNETLLFVEEEGFTNNDISESGDFDEFGDEAFDLAFGKELSEYHWEYWVSEIDLALAGDLAKALPLSEKSDPIRQVYDEVLIGRIAATGSYVAAMPYLKAWFELLDLRAGPMRPPVAARLSAAERDLLGQQLEAAGAI